MMVLQNGGLELPPVPVPEEILPAEAQPINQSHKGGGAKMGLARATLAAEHQPVAFGLPQERLCHGLHNLSGGVVRLEIVQLAALGLVPDAAFLQPLHGAPGAVALAWPDGEIPRVGAYEGYGALVVADRASNSCAVLVPLDGVVGRHSVFQVDAKPFLPGLVVLGRS